MKTVEESISDKLLDISLGNDFLDLIQKAKATKANKWNCIKQAAWQGKASTKWKGSL